MELKTFNTLTDTVSLPIVSAVQGKTVGYVIWGLNAHRAAEMVGSFANWVEPTNPTIFGTMEAAVAAIVGAEKASLGNITIRRVVETTYTETKRSYEAI